VTFLIDCYIPIHLTDKKTEACRGWDSPQSSPIITVRAGILVYVFGLGAAFLINSLYCIHQSLLSTQKGLHKYCSNCLLKRLEHSNPRPVSYTFLPAWIPVSKKNPLNFLSVQTVPNYSLLLWIFIELLTAYKTHWHWPDPVLYSNMSFLCAMFCQQHCKCIKDGLCLHFSSLCSQQELVWALRPE
jgi:hypothetical protein